MPDGVKLNSTTYCDFLREHLMPWIENQNEEARTNMIFQQDNALSHASRQTKQWLESVGCIGEKLMDWPSKSPDLNPIEHYWAVLKRKIYADGRQFASKDELWDAI